MKFSEKNSNKLNIALFVLCLILITAVMFVFIGQKEGFHEDEIYSYGSSNYKYGDVFYASADRDATNRVVDKYIMTDDFSTTVKNIMYYRNHPEEFDALEEAEIQKELPVWKTPEEAKEYLSVSEGEELNYASVYYNQSRDVHPPLFYCLVHLVCSFFVGTFSKYTIFAINLVFLLATCFIIRKILKLYRRENLIIPSVLLYGLSMGAISTVVFLRMYSMLTFFVMAYFYINLKISKNDFTITKKYATLLIITTVLGFLTQYYFCLFAISVFSAMLIRALQKKHKKSAIKYIIFHIVSAVIGIVIFPSSIEHIFSSSRGIGNSSVGEFFPQLEVMIQKVLYSFSFNRFLGVAVFLLVISYIFVKLIEKTDTKDVKSEKVFNILIFVVPIVVYVLLVAKFSPNLDPKTMVRYVTPILPLITISFVVFLEKCLKTLSFSERKVKNAIIYAVVFITSASGFLWNTPSYLYKGYNNYLKVAEEHKDLDFVYVYDNYFTHLNSLPEMMIYNKTLIINLNDGKQSNSLTTNEELKNKDRFVLSIKKWMNTEVSLEKVLTLTGYTKAEVLLDQEDDTQSIIYLVSR